MRRRVSYIVLALAALAAACSSPTGPSTSSSRDCPIIQGSGTCA